MAQTTTRLLPEGPWILQVEAVGRERRSRAGHRLYNVRLRPIVGIEKDAAIKMYPRVYWWLTEHPKARWVWDGVMDTFDPPQLMDRRFLFVVYHEEALENDRLWNRVNEPLCEVIPDYKGRV